MSLTEREIWLMRQARLSVLHYENLEDWLEDVVDDVGDTVEMALAHDAPKDPTEDN